MKPSEVIDKDTYSPTYESNMQLWALSAMVKSLHELVDQRTSDIDNYRVDELYDHDYGGDPDAVSCMEATYFRVYACGSLAGCFTQFVEGLIRNYALMLICTQK